MNSFKEEQEKWEKDNLLEKAKKSSEAKRWKQDKLDPYRTDYQRDIGRILYSDAFRRLRMKTQVFSASGQNQHDRTRLTHTIEVAQIAKSIARPLRLNTDLTEAIAYGHDLGHTPFGHAGESALQKCLEGKGTFNHNVQGVWLVRTTLSKRRDINGKLYPGFNLTHDVVEGIWKHTDYKNTVTEYEELKNYHPDNPSSLEGQVVDIADGIAYLMHDIPDGVRNRLLSYSEVEEVWKQNTDVTFDKYHWGYYFIYDVINSSNGKDEIKFSPPVKALFKKIKELVKENVIKSEYVKKMDKRGKEIVATIFEYCMNDPEYVLSKFTEKNVYVLNKYGLERVIVDYIQWLGDENAYQIYKNIVNSDVSFEEFFK